MKLRNREELESIKNTLEMAKESVRKLEYRSIEIINIMTERKRTEKICRTSVINIKQSNILGVSPTKTLKITCRFLFSNFFKPKIKRKILKATRGM